MIRSLAPFRLPGGATDYVVVGSDSGRLVILRFDAAAGAFAKVHQETFGRSGVRRAVPGEYVAVDPKGRAVCVAALERAKFVYVLNRDAEARLTISSPLEAHKSRHIVYDLVGLDVGFDNPQFAAIGERCWVLWVWVWVWGLGLELLQKYYYLLLLLKINYKVN